MNVKFWSAVSGFLAVSIGAFGAHALRDVLPSKSLETFHTATLYHLAHTLAAFIGSYAFERYRAKAAFVAVCFFLSGIVLFSGGLYMYAITQIKVFAIVAPMGGVAFLTGWLFLALTFLRHGKQDN